MTAKKSHSKSHEQTEHTVAHKTKKSLFAKIWVPLVVFSAWYILGLVISFFNFGTYMQFFGGAAAWILIIAIYGIFGWTLFEDQGMTIKEAVKTSALLGVFVGLVSAVVGIIMIQANPAMMDYTMSQIAAAGASVTQDQIEGMMMIGGYAGFITGPLLNAGFGAGLGALGAFIAKKKWINV